MNDSIFLDAVNHEIEEISKELGLYDSRQLPNNDKPIEEKKDPLDGILTNNKYEIEGIEKGIVELSNKEKQRILQKPRDKEAIRIDEDGDVICAAWGNYYLAGHDEQWMTLSMIDDYLEECNKSINDRNFDFLVVGLKNVQEVIDIDYGNINLLLEDFMAEVESDVE